MDAMKLLKFYAEWCQPCKTLVEKMKTWDENLLQIVENIDIDSPWGRNLCQQYNVRSIPTIILVDDTGTVVYRPGFPEKSEKDLLEYLRN